MRGPTKRSVKGQSTNPHPRCFKWVSIFEEESHHIAIGLEYLPAIARRLHHSRELGEPFDFLTWFEYAPEYMDAFEQLVLRLRDTKEWKYVDREIDIRLVRS